MLYKFIFTAFLSGLFLTSCTNKDQGSAGEKSAAEKPRAVVVMRDVTQVEGTIVDTSGTEIEIAGNDPITRTIPTTQVKSINYADAPTEPARAQAAAPASPNPLVSPKPPRAPSRSVAPSAPDIGSVRVPVETILTFNLDTPLHVVAAR